MKSETRPKAPVSIPGSIIMPYRYAAGDIASKFFIELRDNKRIMGTKCTQCNRVYIPPRSTCIRCFGKIKEWVEVDCKGILASYTVVHFSLPVHPLQPPFAYGIIRLDGADTGLTHFLGEVKFCELKVGMRVKAVFGKNRKGNILDIKYFKPI